MTRKIIVNADDFGRHVLINQAVAEGVQKGILRSATVMVGGAAFLDAVELAKREPLLGVGIHLTLVDGRPVLPKKIIPSLIDPQTGMFYPNHAAFVKHFLKGGVRLAEVKQELTAQIETFLRTGLLPTHVDSHQHMHVLPGIIDTVIALCRQYKIPALRIPAIPVDLWATRRNNIGEQVGRTGLHVLAQLARRKAHAAGLLTTDYFGGIVAGEAVDKKTLRLLLLTLKEGVTEIMLHPGTDNKVLIPATAWQHNFEAELEGIVDPGNLQIAKERAIQPVNFAQLC